MDNTITDSNDKIFYVIRVNGRVVSTQFTDRVVAEVAKQDLPPEQQVVAEVVPVTADGLELLLE